MRKSRRSVQLFEAFAVVKVYIWSPGTLKNWDNIVSRRGPSQPVHSNTGCVTVWAYERSPEILEAQERRSTAFPLTLTTQHFCSPQAYVWRYSSA